MLVIHQCFLVAIGLLVFASPAYAYIGPGMGGGAIAAVLGVVAALFLGLFGIVYYPIKRALKNKKAKKDNANQQSLEDV